MTSFDIYNYSKRINDALDALNANSKVCSENKQTVKNFVTYGYSTGLSTARIALYIPRLCQLADWIGKPFESTTKKDLEELVAEIEKNPEYAPATKNIYRVTLKKLYKWLEGNGESYPEKIKWLKTVTKHRSNLMPEELLTSEDVQRLITAATNSRDKAFIHVLYESGCRIGEIMGMKIKHIAFDEHGVKIAVDGKTGPRRVRLVASIHHLSYWLENHPEKDNPDATLWPLITREHKGDNMNYAAISRLLHHIAKKAKVKKKVNPHSFRHARATQLAGLINQSHLARHMGWVDDTKMTAVYVHLSGKDIDNAILGAYGLKPKDDQDTTLKCMRCAKSNEVNNRFCRDCGAPLSIHAGVELMDQDFQLEGELKVIMDALRNPRIRSLLATEIAMQSKKEV